MSTAKQHLFTCRCHCTHELTVAVTACTGSAQDPHKIPAWVDRRTHEVPALAEELSATGGCW